MSVLRVRHLLAFAAVAGLLLTTAATAPNPSGIGGAQSLRDLRVTVRIVKPRQEVCVGDSRRIIVSVLDAGRRTWRLTSDLVITFLGTNLGKLKFEGSMWSGPHDPREEMWEYRATSPGQAVVYLSVAADGYRPFSQEIRFQNVKCEWRMEAHFETLFPDEEGWGWQEIGDVASDVVVVDPTTGDLTGGSASGGTFDYRVRLERWSASGWRCTPVDIRAPGDFDITGNVSMGTLRIQLENVSIRHKGYETTCDNPTSGQGAGRRSWKQGDILSSYFASGTTPLGMSLWADEKGVAPTLTPLTLTLLTGLPANGFQDYRVWRKSTSY